MTAGIRSAILTKAGCSATRRITRSRMATIQADAVDKPDLE